MGSMGFLDWEGSYQKAVGADFNLPMCQASVSVCIREVTQTINDHLLHEWVKFPLTAAERRVVIQRHFVQTGVPGLLGFIDGTHIAIRQPHEHEENYVNRKGFHSLNVLLTCNSDLVITNVVARFPGSTHDSFIWRYSLLRRVLHLQYTEANSGWLFGDSGFPQEPWLHTPVQDAEPGSPEARYNNVHKEERSCVERVNGVLKKRFRCLLRYKTLEYEPEKCGQLVNACVVLHNMCRQANIPDPEDLPREVAALEVDVNADAPLPPGLAAQRRCEVLREGQRVRALLIERIGGRRRV